MTTFKVDRVATGKFNDEYHRGDNKQTIRGLVGNGVEASSVIAEGVIFPTHNLIATVNTAYDQHLPLTLSPDMLWLMISQGLSTHITNNAEELREQFVDFEGKKELVVYEDSFVKGDPTNNWPHMFGQFSEEIAKYIGKKRNLIVNSFSTTGPVELAASEVVLMEAMSKYFDYTCRTCCGIPEITLLGSVSDWQDISARVKAIGQFELGWWTEKLQPIVDEFVKAAQGKADASFWQSIYKESGGSGGPFISGWITHLFPYLKDYKTGEFTQRNDFRAGRNTHLTDSQFPMGMAKVPFKWEYFEQEFQMELAAGFTGFQMEDGSAKPQIGWFVRDTESVVDVVAKYKAGKDYLANDTLRQSLLSKLEPFGFERSHGYDMRGNISGSIPKAKLEQARQVEGLLSLDLDSKSRE